MRWVDESWQWFFYSPHEPPAVDPPPLTPAGSPFVVYGKVTLVGNAAPRASSSTAPPRHGTPSASSGAATSPP